MEVWDCHLLFGTDHWMRMNNTTLPFFNKQCAPVLANDTFSIGRSFITPFPSSPDQAYAEENALIFEAAEKSATGIPVYALNPNNTANRNTVQRFTDGREQCGIILWPILCQMDLSALIQDPWFRDFMEHFKGWIYIHTAAGNEEDLGRVKKQGNYNAKQVLELAQAFPKNKFILGHLLRLSVDELWAAREMDNVVLDTSLVSGQLRWFEKGKNVFPAASSGKMMTLSAKQILECLIGEYQLSKKLVFGSSYPYCQWWGYSYDDEIRLITGLNVSDRIKQDILCGNIREFLGL